VEGWKGGRWVCLTRCAYDFDMLWTSVPGAMLHSLVDLHPR
jgi:hypothetical protein